MCRTRRYSGILRPIDTIVIDANALLSIVIGGKAARRVVTHRKAPELVVTLEAYAEVEEYIPILAKRKKLNQDLLWAIWRTILVETMVSPKGGQAWDAAWTCLCRRDPEDVPTLALALEHGWPIWSQDRDFEEAKGLCNVYSTANLLTLLDEE